MGDKKAVFIDLQGTLGGAGIDDIRNFTFYPFSFEAIRLLNSVGLLSIIITNQGHIAKGYFTMEDLNRHINRLKADLNEEHVRIDGFYCCPHSHDDNCDCYKPKPGLAYRAATDFNLNLKECYVIGDTGMHDMLLAKNIGCKSILVKTGTGVGSLTEYRNTWKEPEPTYIAENVLEAVKSIIINASRN